MPKLSAPIFSMDFRPPRNESAGAPYMIFGEMDEMKPRSNSAQVPIDRSTGRWIANGITFGFQGRLLNEPANLLFGTSHVVVPYLTRSSDKGSTADTGGDSHINAPFTVVEEYYSRIETVYWSSQLGGFNCTVIIPCNSVLPDLQMHIGNGTAKIRGTFMNGRPLTGPANPAWGRGKQHLPSYIFLLLTPLQALAIFAFLDCNPLVLTPEKHAEALA